MMAEIFLVFQRFLRIFFKGCSKILHQSQSSNKFKDLQFDASYGFEGSMKATNFEYFCVLLVTVCVQLIIGNCFNNSILKLGWEPLGQSVPILDFIQEKIGSFIESIYQINLGNRAEIYQINSGKDRRFYWIYLSN